MTKNILYAGLACGLLIGGAAIAQSGSTGAAGQAGQTTNSGSTGSMSGSQGAAGSSTMGTQDRNSTDPQSMGSSPSGGASTMGQPMSQGSQSADQYGTDAAQGGDTSMAMAGERG